MTPSLAFFTDFGFEGPYVGQMTAAAQAVAPDLNIIQLMHDVPPFDVTAGAWLLAASVRPLDPETVICAVVDPGVGTARGALVVEADRRIYVGPDNGLFSVVVGRASEVRTWAIRTESLTLSASFHGRDLFAPVAAGIAKSGAVKGIPGHYHLHPIGGAHLQNLEVGEEVLRPIYIDRFGNVMLNCLVDDLKPEAELCVEDVPLRRARTFGDVRIGDLFWYKNALGLAEIAVNQGRADKRLKPSNGDWPSFTLNQPVTGQC